MERIHHFEPEKMSVSEALERMRRMGFGARRLALGCDVIEEMIRDEKCLVFMGLAGAMVPAGMKRVILKFIQNGWVDVLVTTGANLTHDLVEAFGGSHYLGSDAANDSHLREEEINRIFDVFMPNEVYLKLEENLQPIFSELSGKRYSVKEFLAELGKRAPEGSILRACVDNNVDLYCPGIADSGIGLQMWLFLQENDIIVDTFSDLKDIIKRAWDAERTGAIIIGGGVPKNFVLQTLQATDKEHTYAVQITTDRAESGGLSGAHLREGISWGKIGKDAKYVDVICDATIALPLITSALMERL